MDLAVDNAKKLTEVLEFPALKDPRFPVHKSASLLEPYLRTIVDKVHPEKIILFGSQAYGSPTIHSDFDLVVVRDHIASSKESNLEIRRAIRDIRPAVGFTFLSKTPEQLIDREESGSAFYTEILRKGLVLYEREN